MIDRSNSGVPASVSAVMRANKPRDTKPELRLRRALHQRGHRFRVAFRIPGTRRSIDIAYTRKRIAVFVDGCFWHGCPEHARPSRRNAAFWVSKIASNRSRDAETDELLRSEGWRVIRIWEHEELEAAIARIEVAVRSAGRAESIRRDLP